MIPTFSHKVIALQALDEAAIASAELEQHLEAQAKAITLPPGFRKGYDEDASAAAEKTLQASVCSTQSILQMAMWVQEMKSRLNRKEFSSFVNDLLGWVGEGARKYLDIAKAFGCFPDMTVLSGLEPFMLLKLSSKRYAPVIERLREEANITQKRVQDLIQDLLPKQPRKKKQLAQYGDAVLQRHPDMENGTFYFTLKEVNLSDKVGLWLEEKLQTHTVGQLLEQAAEWERSYLVQAGEYSDGQTQDQETVSEMRSLSIEKEKLKIQLREQERRIAELEVQLAESAQSSPSVNLDEQKPDASLAVVEDLPKSDETSSDKLKNAETWEEVAKAVNCDRNCLLKIAKTWTPEERKTLPNLLSKFLERVPNALNHVTWVSENLLFASLNQLSFTIQRIAGSIYEPEIENVKSCRFVSLQQFGTRQERWIFASPDGRVFPLFGQDDFEIE